ncbi:hypothetical protein TcasGA2_TC015389 [Tribolium castaneum]|uniref:CUB domain-containing protein n=1 Tax=Tribolium castaneum TaxID=7070 RepID=D2A4L7_TRICA|nr:hypothetical protein TcasGA2_TC015389 [Tribolium castaneum]
MLLVIVLVLPLVRCNDIIRFDFWEPPELKNEIESEFGVFVDKRPKFHTETGRTKINNLLKNHLTRLYEQKFKNHDHEAKFFGTALQNKTKKFNKFLSLFQIVQFENSECQSSSTFGDYLGTCYHETECSALNGTNLGDCADGYGVCCVFRNTCGTSSNRNCTYFESPGYPDYDPPGSMVLPPSSSTMPPPITPDPRFPITGGTTRQSDTTMECTINIYKLSDNVQQMRLDFIDLELRGPVNGTCSTESLYYTGVTGMISSFNYDQAAINNRSQPGYFNNLNYAICIRKEAGFCSITYTNMPNGLEYPFQLVNLNEAGESTVPAGQAGAEIFNCPDDYIIIGGTRLCGDKFNDGALIEDFTMNAPVTDSSAGPIVIPVRTDGSVTGRGFKLFYTQNRCV